MIELLVGGLLNGLLPLALAVYVRPSVNFFRAGVQKIDDHFSRGLGEAFFFGTLLMGAYGAANLVLAVAGLLFGLPNGLAAVRTFAAPMLLLTAVGLFHWILISDPERDHSIRQMTAVWGVVAVVLAGLGTAVWQGQRLASQAEALPTAPFVYDDESVVVLRPDGLRPSKGQVAHYCEGDIFLVQFGGHSDGSGIPTNVIGRLMLIDRGINNTPQTSVVGRYDKTTLAREPAEPQDYDLLPPFNSFTIPADALPEGATRGEFTWQHSNTAVDEMGQPVSLTDSFTSEIFIISDCSQGGRRD